MTGRALLNFLSVQPAEVLDNYDLSVKVKDEFYTLLALTFHDDDADGILDEGSPVLISLASNRNLTVDGHSETDGVFMGDGQLPPFVVFDADQQKNIAGPFNTRAEAETHMEEIQNGEAERLDVPALQAWVEKLDT